MSRIRRRIRLVRRRVLDLFLDSTVETSAVVRLDEIGLSRPGYYDYEPSGWRSLGRALKGMEVNGSDSFLDVGCGKGRVLAQAARRPFGRVIGLELSPDLAEQARALLDVERKRRRCGSAEVVVGDATSWTVPDDITVVYFYNALGGESLWALLDRIADSARRDPRPIRFIYLDPMAEAEIETHPAFTLFERRGRKHWDERDPRRISIFDVAAS